MKAAYIPFWRIVINWAITVITGSIVWPLLLLIGGGEDFEVLTFIGISAMASAVTSLPAVGILIVATIRLNKRKVSWREHWRTQNLVHVGVAILTFGVLGILSNGSLFELNFGILLIPITYTFIGLSLAWYTYSIYRRRAGSNANYTDDYLEKNKAAWNTKTGVHIVSDFYDMPAFLRGETTLKAPELGMLGDVSGKRILHLQCHFGQDTLSLARMGAHVTGVDLSDAAIMKARELAQELKLQATFVNCDLYSLKEHLEGTFDIVFTSYGTISWLPDLDKWADIVQHFLKPSGKFIMVDFHPVVWMFDDHFKELAYSYFNRETIVEQLTGSYADRSANIAYETVSWNHPTSEILQSLIDAGLQLKHYKEWDYSPYACFQELQEDERGVFRIKDMNGKLPMMYGIVAEKSGYSEQKRTNYPPF